MSQQSISASGWGVSCSCWWGLLSRWRLFSWSAPKLQVSPHIVQKWYVTSCTVQRVWNMHYSIPNIKTEVRHCSDMTLRLCREVISPKVTYVMNLPCKVTSSLSVSEGCSISWSRTLCSSHEIMRSSYRHLLVNWMAALCQFDFSVFLCMAMLKLLTAISLFLEAYGC